MNTKIIKKIISTCISLMLILSPSLYAYESVYNIDNSDIRMQIEQKLKAHAIYEMENEDIIDSESERIQERKKELLNIIKANMDYAGLTLEEKDFIFDSYTSNSDGSTDVAKEKTQNIFGKIIIEELENLKKHVEQNKSENTALEGSGMLLNMIQIADIKKKDLQRILVIVEDILLLNTASSEEVASVLASNLAKNPNISDIEVRDGKSFKQAILVSLAVNYTNTKSQSVLAASMTIEDNNLNPYYHEKFFNESDLYSHVTLDAWDFASVGVMLLIAAGFINIILDKKITVQEKKIMEKNISKVVSKGKFLKGVSLDRKDILKVGKIFSQTSLRKIKVDLMRLMLNSDITWSFGFHNARIYIVRSFLQTAVMVFFFSKGSPKDLTSNMKIMHEFYLLNILEQKKRTIILADKINSYLNSISKEDSFSKEMKKTMQNIERANRQIILSEKEKLEETKLLYKYFYKEEGVF